MTQEEQKSINQVYALMTKISEENNKFKSDVKQFVDSLNTKVQEKHTPIHLEGDILAVVQSSMSKAIEESLKGYKSPLLKLVSSVVDNRSQQLREIISTSFDQVINTEDFKNSIVAAFSHKVAKTIISNNDGLFDKVANELKQDAIFKSKMSIAVSNVVEECIRNNPLR